jgi:phenylalanine-4-hydroxylase
MRTKYRIDSYQSSYFVIRSYDELFAATAPDFTPIYQAVRDKIKVAGEIEPDATLPGEYVFT